MKQNETKYETSSSHRKIQSFHHEETLLLPRRDTKMAKKILIKSQSNLLVAQPWRSPGKGCINFFRSFFKVRKGIHAEKLLRASNGFAEPWNDWTMDDSLNDLPEKPGKNEKRHRKKRGKATDHRRSPDDVTATRRLSWLIQPFGVSLACEATWLQVE